jgi:hypothetical protein
VLAFVTIACGDPEPEHTRAASARAEQVRTLANRAGLDADATDVLVRAARAGAAVYTVTYLLSGEAGGTAIVTQDPPLRRLDLTAGDEVQTVIATGESVVLCTPATSGWDCEPTNETTPLAAFGDDQLDAVVEQLERTKDSYVFRAARREVAGIDARCLVSEPRPGAVLPEGVGGKGTLCVSDEGVLLLVETPSLSLRADRYRASVAEDAFAPPG